MANVDIERVWPRIVVLEGQVFKQKRGQQFVYTVRGNALIPSTTNQALGKNQFAAALAAMPTDGPGALQHLRGPSYLWAILMDERVRRTDW